MHAVTGAGSSFPILKQEHKKSYPVFASDFSVLLHYRLLSVSSAEELTSYADVSPDLADRIWKLRSDYTGLASFVSLIKTKQYTEARVRRALLHILLDLKESQLQTARSHGFHYYIRPLGFRKTAAPLLREIKKGSTLPFLAKLADASTVLSHDGLDVLKQNIFASEVYHSTVTGKFHGTSYNEYCRQLIIC